MVLGLHEEYKNHIKKQLNSPHVSDYSIFVKFQELAKVEGILYLLTCVMLATFLFCFSYLFPDPLTILECHYFLFPLTPSYFIIVDQYHQTTDTPNILCISIPTNVTITVDFPKWVLIYNIFEFYEIIYCFRDIFHNSIHHF